MRCMRASCCASDAQTRRILIVSCSQFRDTRGERESPATHKLLVVSPSSLLHSFAPLLLCVEEMEELDLDSSSSAFRARSNTWPLPRPDLQIGDDVYGLSPSSEENEVNDILISDVSDHHISPDHVHRQQQQHQQEKPHLLVRDSSSPCETVIPTTAHEVLSLSKNQRSLQPSSPGAVSTGATTQPSSQSKKNTARRNAWGNMSYADLITQAIQGSPDKRLTLSQIYEWMVQNVPYFKDKGDSNSSAGWKVSPSVPSSSSHEAHRCPVCAVCECYNTFYQLHENVLLSESSR